jgi:hypothetical protein
MITYGPAMSGNEYSAFASKNNDDNWDEIQSGSQNSQCEAGEDNNNSCNNISISRQGDGSGGDSGGGNKVQVSKQNSQCEAGEDNNNSCNNISISRQGDGSNNDYNGDDSNKHGNILQVFKQNSQCEAGEDNNNSCNNFNIQDMIESKIKMISDIRP